MVFLIRIFFIFDLLVYSRRMISVWRIGDFITNPSSSKASYHAGIPYYSMDFYGFLSVSSAWSRSPKEILLIISLIQFASYYSYRSIYWSFGTIRLSADIRSLLLWHRQKLYTLGSAEDAQVLRFYTVIWELPSYSYLKWYNPHPYHFCVHLPLIEISRTKFL